MVCYLFFSFLETIFSVGCVLLYVIIYACHVYCICSNGFLYMQDAWTELGRPCGIHQKQVA